MQVVAISAPSRKRERRSPMIIGNCTVPYRLSQAVCGIRRA
jgi:hypothetical protein